MITKEIDDMPTMPDILADFTAEIPNDSSNTNELVREWEKYIGVLKSEFSEITIRDQGDTVCLGELSPGCSLCKNGNWDCCFITPACNLNCEFCLSPFSAHSAIPVSAFGKSSEEIIANYKNAGIKGISFSGGEPFLNFPEIIRRLEVFKQNLPDSYFWLYTNGVLVTKSQIDMLADAGINEIRYNTAATGYTDTKILQIIEYSAKKIARVTVEIPIIVKDKTRLFSAFSDYAQAGVQFLNVHELMKERHSPSAKLEHENFKRFIFEDGHSTEISLDSKWVVNEIIRKMIDSKSTIQLNFCSTMNKLRQIRKRRHNMLRLLKNPYEKIVDEAYVETVFLFRDKATWQFIHPDDWTPDHPKFENFSAMKVKKSGPLSVFNKSVCVSVKKL